MKIILLMRSVQFGQIQRAITNNVIWSIIIYLIASIPVALMNSNLAKSKGQSKVFWSLFSFVPLVGSIVAPLYLMSLPDEEILENINKQISNAEKELKKIFNEKVTHQPEMMGERVNL